MDNIINYFYLKDYFDYTKFISENPIRYNVTISPGHKDNTPHDNKMITLENCTIKKQIKNIDVGCHFRYIMFDCFNNCYFINCNNAYHYNTATDSLIHFKYSLLIDDNFEFNHLVGENGMFYIYKNNRIIKNVKSSDKFHINYLDRTIEIDQIYCHENTCFYPDKTILANVSIDLINNNINSHYDVKHDLKIKFE